MAKNNKAPEMTFQQHIANFLVREHEYGVLEQSDITDTEHFIAEDQLWAFLKATQAETLKKLKDDYGTDARDEVFRALRKELDHTPLWMILRHGLKVRGLEFHLYYPRPRSAESAAASETRRKPHHLPPAFLLWRDQSGDRFRLLPQRPAYRGIWRSNTRRTRTCMTPWRSLPPATTPEDFPASVPLPGRRHQRRDGRHRSVPR